MRSDIKTPHQPFALEPLEPRALLSTNLDAFQGDSLTWIDASTGHTTVGGIADGDLVLLSRNANAGWTHRNLSDELGVTIRLGPRLTQWESPRGLAGIAALDIAGRIVIFQETGRVLNAPPPPVPPVRPTEPVAPKPPAMPWTLGLNIAERYGQPSLPGLIAEARRNVWTGQREIVYDFRRYEALHPDLQRFIRAQEFAHHILGHMPLYESVLHSGRYDLYHKAEYEADRYAAELLAIEHQDAVDAAMQFLASGAGPSAPTEPPGILRAAAIDDHADEAAAEWKIRLAEHRAAYAKYEAELAKYNTDYQTYLIEDAKYRQLLEIYVPLDEWQVKHVGRDDLALRGKHTPQFTGALTSYAVSWGGITVAGKTAGGQLEAVWWVPGLELWDTANLSTITGLETLSTDPVSFVTSWNAMNIGGLTADGSIHVAWWTPATNRWQVADLSELSGAPPLTGNLISYVTAWGGMHIIGTTFEGDLYGVWWAPGTRWTASDLSNIIPDAPRFEGGIAAFAEPRGRTNIIARAPGAQSVALWWRPGAPGWTAETVPATIDDLLWSNYTFAGTGNGTTLRSLATIARGRAHWAAWTTPSQWQLLTLSDVSDPAVLWPK